MCTAVRIKMRTPDQITNCAKHRPIIYKYKHHMVIIYINIIYMTKLLYIYYECDVMYYECDVM